LPSINNISASNDKSINMFLMHYQIIVKYTKKMGLFMDVVEYYRIILLSFK